MQKRDLSMFEELQVTCPWDRLPATVRVETAVTPHGERQVVVGCSRFNGGYVDCPGQPCLPLD